MILTTDVCPRGWRAHCQNKSTQGRWIYQQTKLHINALELLAVWKALKVFQHIISQHVVLVQTNNSIVLHYINKSGSTKSVLLCQTTWNMMMWCIGNNIHLQAQHIPGKDNVLADSLSHKSVSPLEWSLNQDVTNQLFIKWEWPQLNLFCLLPE